MEILLAAALLASVAITANRPAQELPGGAMVDAITGVVTGTLEWLGDLAAFCGRVVRAMFTRPFEWEEFLRQLDSVGAKSLLLVALAGAATGVVLSMQTLDSLSRFGAKSMLPAVIVFSLIKETGPTITGLVVS
jgi:ABC-type transporter Mla maintaining outer membrane lipid asymmetry permease subunit MlaE